MLFRPAAESDLDAIERHYTELLTHEAETGRSTTNWSLGVYPTRQTAAAALAAGTLWVLARKGEPVASVILNHHQDDFYATIGWQYPAPPEQVLVVHTLCIPPRYAGQGLGRECVSHIKQQAAAMGCAVIRLDTWAGNVPAVTLYRKNGFSLCGRAQVLFQGKIPEELVCALAHQASARLAPGISLPAAPSLSFSHFYLPPRQSHLLWRKNHVHSHR